MASTLLSRILPSATGSPSVYETLQNHERRTAPLNHEDFDETAIDEQNLDHRFQDYDVAHMLADATDSQTTTESTAFLTQMPLNGQRAGPSAYRGSPDDLRSDMRNNERYRDEDEVPESLLLEDDRRARRGSSSKLDRREQVRLPSPVPGPSSRATKVQWDTARGRQRTHQEDIPRRRAPPARPMVAALTGIDPAEKAMWKWSNIEDLDNFLTDVYAYYLGNGIWSIMLSRVLNLFTLLFVVVFSTFLLSCIDYKKVPTSKTMSQIVIPQCTKNMSGLSNLFIWGFLFLWIYKVFQYLIDVRRLWHLHEFYSHLLGISDAEMQTISWQEIVGRLMNLRDSNPRTALNLSAQSRRFIGEQSKQRMDAHDIANRLMRKENYMIALFNKDILDFRLPIPFLRHRQMFSKTLEWNVYLCVIDFVFNEQGQVKQLFLKDTHRRDLIEALRRRFVAVGVLSILSAPFTISYNLMVYFLRYFTEFHKNPAQLGSRAYTPLAEWKFREFNELPHLFQRRINMSYPFASRYLDQFPKDKTIQLAKFVAFIAGSLTAVLAVASLLDPDIFIGFEITHERTVLFYLGVFGTVWAVARGMVPEDSLVFDPVFAIQEVIEYTHYQPAHWKDRLHSNDIRVEFSTLYQMKVLIFLEEILSIIVTPFVLWFALPDCSERLVDFFREFTVHVDGLGYVCSFALFDFKKGNATRAAKSTQEGGAGIRDDYYSTKDGKMLSSYFSFIDNYSNNDPRRGSSRQTIPRKHFQHPPAFPGLIPQQQQQQQLSTEPLRTQMTRSAQLPISGRGTVYGSPSPSMLLDPHHQHHPSSPRSRANRSPVTTRIKTIPHPLARHGELDEEESLSGPATAPPISSSVMIEGDSTLGDSWKAAQAGIVDDVVVADRLEAQTDTADKEPGVLGLLYQFQKAQTGTAAGVKI